MNELRMVYEPNYPFEFRNTKMAKNYWGIGSIGSERSDNKNNSLSQ